MRIDHRRVAATPLLVAAMASLCAPAAAAGPLPKVEHSFADGSVLRFYGQINKGFLTYDDGQVSESYDFIDNQNSNTRLGLTYSTRINDQWDYLGTLEIQYAPFSTSNTSLLQPSPPASAHEFTNANIRQIDNRLSNSRVGTFFLGQGDMASQNTAKVDLSGTTVIAGSAVQDSAGGQLLRQADGTLSNIKISSAFTDYNGLGRKVRVRYDTPDFDGFAFRASYGEDRLSSNPAKQDDPLYDIAAVYAGKLGDFTLAAQVAYSWIDADTGMTTTLDGSASALHGPTGLNLTVASASQDNGAFNSSYWYVKGGWLADLVSWGKTAVSLDHYSGSDVQSAGSDSESSGLALVQNVTDWNTEFWLTWRTYDFSTTTVAYDRSDALFFGARFRF